ncbi:peptidoglycan-binding domain-containing protein [Streptomyces sp. NPDC051940]|uniref:peptidoglycan-binding domain-containing protein n=1 Tax=Streptomyces sp. NPDC051940 TaxID=3155675 RepID=UPI00341D87A5
MKHKLVPLLSVLGLALGTVLIAAGPAAASPVCSTVRYLTATNGHLIAVPAYTSGSTYCHLQRGGGGEGVQTLQTSIYQCYYLRGPRLAVFNIARDGSYGLKTEAAVAAVQRYHKIPDDGIYGPQTRNYMQHFANWEGELNCSYFKP